LAFPGTYNFNYYKGDTFEFRVYPLNTAEEGGSFDLSGYASPQDVNFYISTARGSAGLSDQIECYAEIPAASGGGTSDHILCVIRPADGNQLTAGVSYVYDVEITKSGTDYPLTYTLLTGNITVTDQVYGAA